MVTFEKSTVEHEKQTLRGDALIELTEKLVSQGLAPPARIYGIEYRQRINWSKFPNWAWPIDPEVFDGCCHEG